MINTKTCTRCNTSKETDEFYSYVHGTQIIQTHYCKQCKAIEQELKRNNQKKCVNCCKIQPIDNFYPRRKVCKSCHGQMGNKWKRDNRDSWLQYSREYKQKFPEREMLRRTKCRARKLELEFNLDVTDIIIPKFCPILGIEIASGVGSNNKIKDNSPSIDRINNNKGYIKGNIQIISNRANRIKSDSTIEELEQILHYLKGLTNPLK